MFDREIACLLRNIFSCKKKKTTAGVGKTTEWFVKPIQYPSLTMMKLIIAVYAHIKEEKDCLPRKLQKKNRFAIILKEIIDSKTVPFRTLCLQAKRWY